MASTTSRRGWASGRPPAAWVQAGGGSSASSSVHSGSEGSRRLRWLGWGDVGVAVTGHTGGGAPGRLVGLVAQVATRSPVCGANRQAPRRHRNRATLRQGRPAHRFRNRHSGKSTFMHCLAGLDKVTSGQVFIGGTELNSLSDKQLTLLRRERVGFVFQAFNLLPTLTAAENIELPMALAGTKADRSWVDRVIDAVGLRDRLSHRPSELSGGQQQRVAAARALASSPSIVFADEPTGNLDSNPTADKVLDLMKKLGG